ncbi:MAG TPA: chemotaxis protein CheD [Spirochaetota bacterium]|nr:chemotaxis protein CheD [Spirochaetota bacterium]HQO40784.1 chemotaxis protein CheD [Spirochaetota bacterium]
MYVKLRDRLGKKVNIIHPGEYYITREDELIATLLGSCVAVCLHDEVNCIGAMNHYMLPGRITKSRVTDTDQSRYGINSINTIIRLMLDNGASRNTMTARIFGGGSIIKNMSQDGRSSLIPADNVRVARLIMELEDIPIIGSDVGADYTRKIIFDVHTGKVYLRKMRGEEIKNLVLHRDEQLLA